jgi:hypothetical protein
MASGSSAQGSARSWKGGKSINPERNKAGLAIRRATQPPNRDRIKHNAKPVKPRSIFSTARARSTTASGCMHDAFTMNGSGPFMQT